MMHRMRRIRRTIVSVMHRHIVHGHDRLHGLWLMGASLHGRKGQQQREEQAEQSLHGAIIAHQRRAIQIAMAIIMRFSVSDTKPSGTLLLPPTQAHLSVRRSR